MQKLGFLALALCLASFAAGCSDTKKPADKGAAPAPAATDKPADAAAK